jgi:hypothetical protein
MNIKIGKGGNGSIKSNAVGTYSLTISGATYGNGTYERSSGGDTTFIKVGSLDATLIIQKEGPEWILYAFVIDEILPVYGSENLKDWYIVDPVGGTPPIPTNTGKLNEKKYIDLLPPNFISKVTLSGGTYSNGTYTRNSGGTTTFYGPDGKYIELSGVVWYAYDPAYGGDPTYATLNFINWDAENASGVPTGITENSLTFLFDPIFYKNQIQNERYKILVAGCSLDYVNGIYSQTVNPSLLNNRPFFSKDDDINMEIYFDGTNWVIADVSERDGYGYELFYKIESSNTAPSNNRPDSQNWTIGGVVDGGGAMEFETSPGITTYSTNILGYGGDLDPAYMEELRNYQINGTIPTFPNIDVRQHIPGASFNSRKAEFSGNVFKYTKYNNNDDVPHLKTHGKQFYDTLNRGRGPEVGKNLKDNKYPFLFLRRNDSGTIFSSTSSSTLNFFIKLQRPVSHTSPSNYVVREKRGIFLTSYADINRPLTVGYRSPYYNINGDNTYKYKFEPFSFVFSFGQTYTSEFGLANFCVMTDYKYKFGEMYMLTIRWDLGQLYIYVNGEQQTTALLPFNPCYFPSSSNCRNRRQHQERMNYIPLAPGFLKKNGSTYTMTASLWEPTSSNGALHNYLCFGRSPRGQNQFDTVQNGYKRKRYLNNLEAGVIMSYNVALSSSQISQIYENFRYRYI